MTSAEGNDLFPNVLSAWLQKSHKHSQVYFPRAAECQPWANLLSSSPPICLSRAEVVTTQCQLLKETAFLRLSELSAQPRRQAQKHILWNSLLHDCKKAGNGDGAGWKRRSDCPFSRNLDNFMVLISFSGGLFPWSPFTAFLAAVANHCCVLLYTGTLWQRQI